MLAILSFDLMPGMIGIYRQRAARECVKNARAANQVLGDVRAVPADLPVFIVSPPAESRGGDPNSLVAPTRRARAFGPAVLLEIGAKSELVSVLTSFRQAVTVTATRWPDGSPIGQYEIDVDGFGDAQYTGEELAAAKWANEIALRPCGDGKSLAESKAADALVHLGLTPAAGDILVVPLYTGRFSLPLPMNGDLMADSNFAGEPAARQLAADVIAFLDRPNNDFSLSTWPNAAAAKEELSAACEPQSLVTHDGRRRARLLFAPTGPCRRLPFPAAGGLNFSSWPGGPMRCLPAIQGNNWWGFTEAKN